MADRFDKFTERGRRVLTLAHEEAQRFNHNYIDTEHLLLGLVREGDGVAAKVLTNLDVELTKVRSAVEFILGRGEKSPGGAIGLTPRAKKVVELAVEEARRLNHSYIGTEHLLLGLVREGEGIAFGVLESLGVSLERVRTETARILSTSTPAEALPQQPRTDLPTQGLQAAEAHLEDLRQQKESAIRDQEYERAAELRALEALIQEHIERILAQGGLYPEAASGSEKLEFPGVAPNHHILGEQAAAEPPEVWLEMRWAGWFGSWGPAADLEDLLRRRYSDRWFLRTFQLGWGLWLGFIPRGKVMLIWERSRLQPDTSLPWDVPAVDNDDPG